MKAFLTACAVIIVVGLATGFGLNAIQEPTGQAQSTNDNVRLD